MRAMDVWAQATVGRCALSKQQPSKPAAICIYPGSDRAASERTSSHYGSFGKQQPSFKAHFLGLRAPGPFQNKTEFGSLCSDPRLHSRDPEWN